MRKCFEYLEVAIKSNKCAFASSEVKYSGHLNKDKESILMKELNVIEKFPVPKPVTGV